MVALERERQEIFDLLVHSPDGINNWISHLGGRVQSTLALFTAFMGTGSEMEELKFELYSDMRC